MFKVHPQALANHIVLRLAKRDAHTHGWTWAVVALHRGYGPDHLDIFINAGRRCPTVRVAVLPARADVVWSTPHRRRYLTWRGQISGGRGRVQPLAIRKCWVGTRRVVLG